MKYIKDFNKWNNLKKGIEGNSYMPYFNVCEIWWCVLGVNIGVEIDGKGNDFLRPVLILSKYNEFGCLVIPLSSVRIADQDNVNIGIIQDKSATANLSQIKSISSKRLIEKMCILDKDVFLNIQKTVMEYNFPSQLFDIPSPEEESSPKANIVTNI